MSCTAKYHFKSLNVAFIFLFFVSRTLTSKSAFCHFTDCTTDRGYGLTPRQRASSFLWIFPSLLTSQWRSITARSWSSSGPVMLGWRRSEITDLNIYRQTVVSHLRELTLTSPIMSLTNPSTSGPSRAPVLLLTAKTEGNRKKRSKNGIFHKVVSDDCKTIALFYVTGLTYGESRYGRSNHGLMRRFLSASDH